MLHIYRKARDKALKNYMDNSRTCKFCERYNATVYHRFSFFNTWPRNLVTAHPVRIFGIFIGCWMKLAKDTYHWGKGVEDYKNEYYQDEEPHNYLCPIHKSLIFAGDK